MDTKRQRLKLAKRLSKLDCENNKKLKLPEEDCLIIDDKESELKQAEEGYRIEISQTIKDERLEKLRKNLEIVCQKFQSSSFVPFPSLGVNNSKELSLNEKARINPPQWTPFPSVCIECATNSILLHVENNQDTLLNRSTGDTSSSSQGVFSLFPPSFQTDDQSMKLCNEEDPLYSEAESPSKMETREMNSSPDLFVQFPTENQKCQPPEQRTFQDSNSASKIRFPETSINCQTKDLSENKETHSKGKPIQSCPLCQETFPTQMSQLAMDEHIAGCLNAAADDDINW